MTTNIMCRIGIVTAIVALIASCSERREPFDAQAWRGESQPGRDDSVTPTRQAMLADLLDKHVHVGMKRDDVIVLLGPPTSTASLPVHLEQYELGIRDAIVVTTASPDYLTITYIDDHIADIAVIRTN